MDSDNIEKVVVVKAKFLKCFPNGFKKRESTKSLFFFFVGS